jgi:hypothetical protein
VADAHTERLKERLLLAILLVLTASVLGVLASDQWSRASALVSSSFWLCSGSKELAYSWANMSGEFCINVGRTSSPAILASALPAQYSELVAAESEFIVFFWSAVGSVVAAGFVLSWPWSKYHALEIASVALLAPLELMLPSGSIAAHDLPYPTFALNSWSLPMSGLFGFQNVIQQDYTVLALLLGATALMLAGPCGGGSSMQRCGQFRL